MVVLLDNGHGGLINGEYQTPGKRKDWGDDGIIYEGEFNRAIVNGIIEILTEKKIPYVNIAPEYRDVTLATRVNRANKFFREVDNKCFYLSVHANAAGGHGVEIFTSPGNTASDPIATIFGEEFEKTFPDRTLRDDPTDGDLDKEDVLFVLLRTAMPAILTENFFMDNFEEFRDILMTKEGRQKIIDYHVNAILRVQNEIF